MNLSVLHSSLILHLGAKLNKIRESKNALYKAFNIPSIVLLFLLPQINVWIIIPEQQKRYFKFCI